MRIDAVQLTNFRNFKAALFNPDPGVNIFYGDNGAGKTNLLEAIFTLCLGRSQRGARDVMMIRGNGAPTADELSDYFRLEGRGIVQDREVRLTCAFQNGGRKRITIDDNPARLSKLFQFYSLISMAPEDVELLSGAPSLRRRFMDLHLSMASPSYLADLTDYNKALAQKNSFLKNPAGGICPFDPLLIQYGARIMKLRRDFLGFLDERAPGYFQKISFGAEDQSRQRFGFAYKPNVPFEDPSEIESQFEQKLNSRRERERILETAQVGPHRDDIEFTIGDYPARGYGSQGELRSGAIAVMLAAANFLESRREEKPILLLDEIFAELDLSRRDNLAELFADFEQIFLTTAVAPPDILQQRGNVFTIRSGAIA